MNFNEKMDSRKKYIVLAVFALSIILISLLFNNRFGGAMVLISASFLIRILG